VADPMPAADEEHPRGQASLLARLLHRQSVEALTGRAAFPSHGFGYRNRLKGAVRRRSMPTVRAALLTGAPGKQSPGRAR